MRNLLVLLFLNVLSCNSSYGEIFGKNKNFKINISAPYFSYIMEVINHYKSAREKTRPHRQITYITKKLSVYEKDKTIKVNIYTDRDYIGKDKIIMGGIASYTLDKKTGEILNYSFGK